MSDQEMLDLDSRSKFLVKESKDFIVIGDHTSASDCMAEAIRLAQLVADEIQLRTINLENICKKMEETDEGNLAR